MADDTTRLFDALDVDRAHLVGASMGGMIAQEVALRHPRRPLTLTPAFSATSPLVGEPTPEATAAPADSTRGRSCHRGRSPGGLCMYPGMVHDLPQALWPALVEEITTHARAHVEPA